MNTNHLEYVLIDSRATSAEAQTYYDDAFRLWKSVWDETLFELDGEMVSASDEFTRQDMIGAIFNLGRCIGLSCFRTVDLKLSATRLDSYFKCWPESTLRKLVRDGTKILVTTNLTVDPQSRGELAPGLKLKHYLVALQTKVLLDSRADAQSLVPRCDRGMQKVIYKYGATELESDAVLHGVPVHLAAAFRRDLIRFAPLVEVPIEILWRNRRVFAMDRSDLGIPHRQLSANSN